MCTVLLCFPSTFFAAGVFVSFCVGVYPFMPFVRGFGSLVWNFGSIGYVAVLGAGGFFLTLWIVSRRHGLHKMTAEEYNRLPQDEKRKGMWEYTMWMLVAGLAVFMAVRVFGGEFADRVSGVMEKQIKQDTYWP